MSSAFCQPALEADIAALHSCPMASEALKRARANADVTLEELADRTGISTSQLSRFESDKREPRLADLEKIAAALSLTVGDLIGRTEVPVMGYIGAGASVEPEFEQVPPDGLDTIDLPFAVPEEIIAFKVRGESMLPVYRDGDAILVWKDQRLPTESYVGEEAAVRTDDGLRFLKEIQRGRSRATFNLYSHNARLIEDKRLVWVGEIYMIVKASQLGRVQRGQRAAATRKAKARKAETAGMDELPLARDVR